MKGVDISQMQLFYRRIHFLNLIAPVLATGLFTITGCGPVWLIDPGSAERIAKQENKPLMFYFKSWDSTQHRNMRLQVFADSAVAREMTDLVNVELEFAYFPDYRNRYGIKTPQVCVLCDPDGKKVGSSMYVNPVPTPEKFLDWLRETKTLAKPAPNSATPKAGTQSPAGAR